MSAHQKRTIELSIDELLLLDAALQEYQENGRHESALEVDLTGDNERAALFASQATEASELRTKLNEILESPSH